MLLYHILLSVALSNIILFFFCSLGLRLCLVDEWPDIRCVELEILWKYMESKQ